MRGIAGWGRVWVGLWLALALPGVAVAQLGEFAEHTCDTPVSTPGDLTLHLSIEGGQRVFREGEIIPLKAVFRSTSPEGYWVAMQGLDHGGRQQMDTFCITPAKGTDPLAGYFQGLWSDSNSMPASQPLDSTPFQVELELNEWWRLPPGDYRLHIVSPRVTRVDEAGAVPQGEPPLILRSNEVQFRVVKASPEWQAQQLAEAKRVLDATVPDDEHPLPPHAARVLRFLGSEQSTHELARRLATSDGRSAPEYILGLAGSPDRTKAIAAMREVMERPELPISEEYLSTLVGVEIASEGKGAPPADTSNTESEQAAFREYEASYARKMDEGWATAAALVGRKRGRARALTISALLDSKSAIAEQSNAELRRLLVTLWAELPVEKLNELLASRWEQIGGPEWLPALQRIATSRPHDAPYTDVMDRGSALLHLYELSPEQGRDLILKEIGEAHGDIGIDVLGRLPEAELPQFDAALAQRLQSNGAQEIDASLLDRYASAAILNQVQAVFESEVRRKRLCRQESAFLRYFLRVAPDYGVEQLKYVIERPESPCGRFRLAELKQYLRVPKVEQMAFDELEQAPPSVASFTSEALWRFGSADAEAALWKRLEELHTKWKDRLASEFHPDHGGISSDLDNGLELSLVRALIDGQAWCMDEKKLKRLRELASPEALENGPVGGLEHTWPQESSRPGSGGRRNSATRAGMSAGTAVREWHRLRRNWQNFLRGPV